MARTTRRRSDLAVGREVRITNTVHNHLASSQPVPHTRQSHHAGDRQRNRHRLRSRPHISGNIFPNEDRVQGHSFHAYHYTDPHFADQSFEVEYDDNPRYPPGEYPEGAYPGVVYYEDVDTYTDSNEQPLGSLPTIEGDSTPAHRPASPQRENGNGITEVINMFEKASSQDQRDKNAREEDGIAGASSDSAHFKDHTRRCGQDEQHPSANIEAERVSATLSLGSTVTHVHRSRSPGNSNRADLERHDTPFASANFQVEDEHRPPRHRRLTRGGSVEDSSHTITSHGVLYTSPENDIPRVNCLTWARNPRSTARNRRERAQRENDVSGVDSRESINSPSPFHRPGSDRPRHFHPQTREEDADTEPGRRANALVAAAGLGLTFFEGFGDVAHTWPFPGADAAPVATTTALNIPSIHVDVFAPMQTDYIAHLPAPTAPDPSSTSRNFDNVDATRSKLGRVSVGFMLGGIFAGVFFLVLRSLVCKSRRSRESRRAGWREPFSV